VLLAHQGARRTSLPAACPASISVLLRTRCCYRVVVAPREANQLSFHGSDGEIYKKEKKKRAEKRNDDDVHGA
jgi:hypothetical protein